MLYDRQGMVMLCLSASVVPRHYREGAYFVALYVLAVGEGGHKPCVQTFAADQFDEDTDEEKEVKSSFFNWWYLAIVVTGTVATFGIVYIQVILDCTYFFFLPFFNHFVVFSEIQKRF